jgi:hypothetical protein
MPAQTQAALTQYYSEGDTAPPLRATLRDGAGDPIDLTTVLSVKIFIAYSRPTYYYNPTIRIVDGAECIIENQVTNRGEVRWEPQVGDLTPPGAFEYVFGITYGDGSFQTIPPNTYLPLIIRTPVGGQLGKVTSAP